jgi:hypothetical protein
MCGFDPLRWHHQILQLLIGSSERRATLEYESLPTSKTITDSQADDEGLA